MLRQKILKRKKIKIPSDSGLAGVAVMNLFFFFSFHKISIEKANLSEVPLQRVHRPYGRLWESRSASAKKWAVCPFRYFLPSKPGHPIRHIFSPCKVIASSAVNDLLTSPGLCATAHNGIQSCCSRPDPMGYGRKQIWLWIPFDQVDRLFFFAFLADKTIAH